MERRARPEESRLGIVQYRWPRTCLAVAGLEFRTQRSRSLGKGEIFEVEIEIGPVKRERRLCNV